MPTVDTNRKLYNKVVEACEGSMSLTRHTSTLEIAFAAMWAYANFEADNDGGLHDHIYSEYPEVDREWLKTTREDTFTPEHENRLHAAMVPIEEFETELWVAMVVYNAILALTGDAGSDNIWSTLNRKDCPSAIEAMAADYRKMLTEQFVAAMADPTA